MDDFGTQKGESFTFLKGFYPRKKLDSTQTFIISASGFEKMNKRGFYV